MRINMCMYECDNLELLIRFTIDTVQCMHAMHTNAHSCMHLYMHTCVHYVHAYIHVHVHMCMLKHNDIVK